MHDKAKLAKALSRVCAMQGLYGKTAAELETMVEGFCWSLSEYSTDQIIDAMGAHIKKSRDIPTPSDIASIINPPPPKPDWALYNELKKKSREGYYLLPNERKFINQCESIAKLRLQDETSDYQRAQHRLTHSMKLSDHTERE